MDNPILAIDGKLALDLGAHYDQDRPVLVHTYLVSDVPAADFPYLVGQRPWSPSGGPRRVCKRPSGAELVIDMTGWRMESREELVPQPQARRGYTWQWNGAQGRWDRHDVPRCAECGEYHNPDWTVCLQCYACHPAGAHTA